MSATPAITPADADFVEKWESVTPAQNWVIRLDVRGDERPELVLQGREFLITTKERILTQSRVVEEADDPFRNGSFRPLAVPPSISVETNPNALSDDDIRRLLVASNAAWDEYMTVIDSPATLRRMVAIADEPDSAISHRRFIQLAERMKAVHQPKNARQKDAEAFEQLDSRHPIGSPRKGPRVRTP